ncbi:DUF305 domain-containing protein [Skermania sp. ID1734]|nr:DUF305 domain-containing protein [Skermania sp. ID1734]
MRASVLALSLAASGFLAAGCGSDNGASPNTTQTSAASEAHNQADIHFLQMMYPHHAQAIQMADLVNDRTDNQQVRSLAADIKKNQGPEMQQIAGMLQQWGQPAPTAGASAHSSMTGMLSPQQLDALKAAKGADFDKQWLQSMIEHHLGAIEMAKTEIAEGTNPQAIKLARAIVTGQQSEVDQMRTMLGER